MTGERFLPGRDGVGPDGRTWHHSWLPVATLGPDERHPLGTVGAGSPIDARTRPPSRGEAR